VSAADELIGRGRVAERTDLLESAFDSLSEGVALADLDGVVCWNRAAGTITGYSGMEAVGHGIPEVLNKLIVGGSRQWIAQRNGLIAAERGWPLRIRHKAGHELPVLARILVLRDGLGEQIGTGVWFHPVDSIDALPHGEHNEESRISESPSELKERLEGLYQDFLEGDSPLGVLWVTVDEASGMRRTHGARACEAMLEKMERTLASGLKPAEEIGRWGDDEFLVLSHERSAAMLGAHGQLLAGLARTTDFRWWGDRVSLTVSIGAAQAERGETLCAFLERAQAAMLASVRSGGNGVTTIPRRDICSPS
jgi:PAS domain S-box-containing protein